MHGYKPFIEHHEISAVSRTQVTEIVPADQLGRSSCHRAQCPFNRNTCRDQPSKTCVEHRNAPGESAVGQRGTSIGDSYLKWSKFEGAVTKRRGKVRIGDQYRTARMQSDQRW